MKKILLTLLCVSFWGGNALFSQFIIGGNSLKYTKACGFSVEKWLTDAPEMEGKLVFLNFWKPSDEKCRNLIPALNELSRKYAADMVVVGITPEDASSVNAMPGEKIAYYSAVDSRDSLYRYYQGESYPYSVLIDAHGVVVWNGSGTHLNHVDQLVKANRSYVGKKAYPLTIEKWLSDEPDTRGKFVLLDFWSTTCASCIQAFPELNAWSKQFADDLVIIGVCSSSEERIKALKATPIEYYSGIDTKRVMFKQYEAGGLPYAVLIDPDGIIRWNGYPTVPAMKLTAETIQAIIEKYK